MLAAKDRFKASGTGSEGWTERQAACGKIKFGRSCGNGMILRGSIADRPQKASEISAPMAAAAGWFLVVSGRSKPASDGRN